MDYKELYDIALKAIEHAYAPYSHYKVGAAILTKEGSVFTGVNVENSTLGATICAERTAIVKGISEGCRDIIAIAIAAKDNKDVVVDAFPCGICRQFIFEFGENIDVIVGSDRDQLKIFNISELLPFGFRLPV